MSTITPSNVLRRKQTTKVKIQHVENTKHRLKE